MEHTPTPWKYEMRNHVNGYTGQMGFEIEGPQKKKSLVGNIPTFYGVGGFLGNKTDAAFIVKAVNSHEELVAALKVVFHSQAIESMSVREFDQVKEALQKAGVKA